MLGSQDPWALTDAFALGLITKLAAGSQTEDGAMGGRAMTSGRRIRNGIYGLDVKRDQREGRPVRQRMTRYYKDRFVGRGY